SGLMPLQPLLDQIAANPIFRGFISLLKKHNVSSICDIHAHVSSGRNDFVPDASPEDVAELPKRPFTLQHLLQFYRTLFVGQGISVTAVVFDTPLRGYDMRQKNRLLLAQATRLPVGDVKVVPFAVLTPDMTEAEIEGYAQQGARGFKVSPRTTSAYLTDGRKMSGVPLEDMLTPQILKVAGNLRLPVLVHLPQSAAPIRTNRDIKARIQDMLGHCPSLRFVLAHLGSSHSPSRVADVVEWLERSGLGDNVYLDISTVTLPSTLEAAFHSAARLCFGTDIDFCLSEKGRHFLLTRTPENKTQLATPEHQAAFAALVSTSFGSRYREVLSPHGIQAHFPMFMYQMEAITLAAEKVSPARRQVMLRRLFWQNATELLGSP
ncbi:MAG: amidohydrolase family protein, partial [Chloroflexota bacterium]